MMTSHKTEELKEFIDDMEDELNKQTIKTYINDYKRFRSEMTGKHNLSNLPQSEIINIVKKTKFAKLNMLNIAIVFLNWKDKPINMLIKYRTDLREKRTENAVEKNIEIIKNAGATYDDLMRALDKATGTDFLLFYLLINYNTRNNDLIIRVIDAKDSEITKAENFMVVGKNKTSYIRNEYKTKATYGTKTDVIRNIKFQKYIRTELENDNEYLFVNNKMKPYKQTEMGKFIKSRFKKYLKDSNLSQAVIYKIIQHHAEENGNVNMMKNIADARGHSIDTAFQYYSSSKYDNKQAEEIDSDDE